MVAGAPVVPTEIPDAGAPLDLVIVGGGYTGLWTALHVLRARPDASVLVLEAERIGFGASGRNGGWVSALWPVAPDRVAQRHGRAAASALTRTLRETVVRLGEDCAAEGIDAGYERGGMLLVARGPAQEARARAHADHGAAWGDGTVWLDADRMAERIAVAGGRGGTFTPHCARVHPARLAVGLAAAVRRRGGRIVEGARVRGIRPGSVVLEDGRVVRARAVVRGTEAWTHQLAPRALAPVYSLMVATEPLTPAQWMATRLFRDEVFADHGHVVIYGQRTVDGRLAFGGRGAPYHRGSAVDPSFDVDGRVFAALRGLLLDLLPHLGGVRFTHAWGGPLAIARDWHPSVGFDASTGLGWAGGYVGDGVAASHLAGRTLAALVCGIPDAVTALPWVGHRSPRWEPEPLRWAGVNAGLRLAEVCDARERRTGRPTRSAGLLARLTGG